MKTIKIFLISLITTILLSGCYEDKGNYDYNDLVKITLDIGDVKDITLGYVLKITPTITLSKDMPDLHLAYKWILEGDVISTERNLNWVADRYTEEFSDNLIFEVSDLDNDIQYRVAASFSIIGKYEVDGYLVLADKAGKKYLHLLYNSYDEDGNDIYVPLVDVFGLENNGEAIPANSAKFFEHYCRQGIDYKNQIMLLDGDKTFEVEGSSFKKVDYTLQDMFNGAVPADLQNSVKDAFFMQRLDFISDTKGQLYSRVKSTFEFFHSEYFLNTPVTFEGEVLKDIDIVPSSYGCNTPFCLLYDKNKKRFLVIWDFQSSYDNSYVSGKIQKIADNKNWNENVPAANDICKDYVIHRIDSYKRDVNDYPPATRYSCIVENIVSGEYYVYDFGVQTEYGGTEADWALEKNSEDAKVDASIEKIPDDVLSLFTNPDNVIYTLPWGQNGWCTLIAQGRNLYVYNRKAPLAGSSETTPNPRLVSFTFDSEIAAMDGNTYRSNSLGVAFKDGTFQVLDIRNIALGKCNSIWKSESDLDLGTPISVLLHTTGNLNLDWRDQ
ncbi:PKD-like family lipoprotein [Bacteroides thetaiotaomicron]|uniref:PKD-like family lipoprotein n=1 Tax=Bacteroides thetaiotaomicron TaxID=818 RepID=UPI001EEC18A7|nr:PKD-like family lipoprotein [Bacteroides thetaiotaomicron]MCE8780265.1 hypothetical protein [Bacteroides thetaiotaomicron]